MMNPKIKNSDGNKDGPLIFIQDGYPYPEKPPWDPGVTRITSSLVFIFFWAGLYGTFKVGFLTGIIWILAFCFKLFAVRYMVCARCPYYGCHCSCFYGKLAAFCFDKQENKSMELGLWIDLLVWSFIFMFPLYHYIMGGMLFYAGIWCLLFLVMFGSLSILACSICPFEFCPQGLAGRWVGRFLKIRE